MPEKPIKPNSTQAHLPFAGVEDGIVVMPDGSYRVVLAVGATNFSLKSQQEQDAIIVTYQNFLNSLNYSIQILMQSRTLDLEPYLQKLEESIPSQRNDLIKQQTADYAAYMRELITAANIMDKRFYVVIAYSPVQMTKQGFLSSLFARNSTGAVVKIDQKLFETHRDELKQRAGIVSSGLSSLGLKVKVLETDDVIRLFYSCYNIDLAAEERVDNPQLMTENIIESVDEQAKKKQPVNGTEEKMPQPATTAIESQVPPPQPQPPMPTEALNQNTLPVQSAPDTDINKTPIEMNNSGNNGT